MSVRRHVHLIADPYTGRTACGVVWRGIPGVSRLRTTTDPQRVLCGPCAAWVRNNAEAQKAEALRRARIDLAAITAAQAEAA